MAAIECKTPLIWPDRVPETEAHIRSVPTSGISPNLPFQDALQYLSTEAFIFPCELIILTTNYEHIAETGLRKRVAGSPGASILFHYEEIQYLIPCDRWSSTPHNIYALHLMLRNIMQNVKWGFGPLPILLQGYVTHGDAASASSVTTVSASSWWLQYLGLGTTARLSDANAVYRSRAKEIGQDEEKLLKLNEAISLARQALR